MNRGQNDEGRPIGALLIDGGRLLDAPPASKAFYLCQTIPKPLPVEALTGGLAQAFGENFSIALEGL
jgi:hypothetical protein